MVDPTPIEIMKTFFDYWQNFILASGVFVAIFVAYWTVRNDRKNLKLNGLNIVFQKFNDQKSRESRRKIISAYYNFLLDADKPTEFTSEDFLEKHPQIDIVGLHPDLQDDVESLKSDFEQVAVMTKNGLVDEKAYFDAYYGSMLRCYGALHGNIEKSRDKSGTKHYTVYFQEQSEKAVKYWKKNHEGYIIKYYGDEKTDFVLRRFEKSNVWKIGINNIKTTIQNCQVFSEREPLVSGRHTNALEHTIVDGSGDNFYMVGNPLSNPIITIKSDGHTLKRIRFLDIEETDS